MTFSTCLEISNEKLLSILDQERVEATRAYLVHAAVIPGVVEILGEEVILGVVVVGRSVVRILVVIFKGPLSRPTDQPRWTAHSIRTCI